MAVLFDPKNELISAIPRLRTFAFFLCRESDRADDLVQQTLMKAWANMSSFELCSNIMAWLYTIMRNEFYSEFRKRRHEVPDTDGAFAARLASCPTQDSHINFQDFSTALLKLDDDQREALLLVGASELSYQEAAKICQCAVGTVKSRVHRGRSKLAQLLSIGFVDQIEADRK